MFATALGSLGGRIGAARRRAASQKPSLCTAAGLADLDLKHRGGVVPNQDGLERLRSDLRTHPEVSELQTVAS